MGTRTREKLNWLQHNLPEGLLVDAGWLEQRDYSRGLRKKYVAGGWLTHAARGVYLRPPARLSAPLRDNALRWQQAVIPLQTLYQLPLAVGGRTALELQGYAHYLSASGPREVHLYGDSAPPPWLKRLTLDATLVFHNAKKLFRDKPITLDPKQANGTDALPGGLARQPWGHWEWRLTLSAPERAILELLDEVPQRETFHQADMLMDGLRNLRPRKLHQLLADCRSIKVKRLFFWFAERHDHAWLKQLDRTGIDLGRGKRMLVRGGRLDPKFNITVPENLDAGG